MQGIVSICGIALVIAAVVLALRYLWRISRSLESIAEELRRRTS